MAQRPGVSEEPTSLTRSTMSGMFWTASSNGLNAVLKILVLVVLTRLLTPADFGIVSAALIVIGFSVTFSQLGLGPLWFNGGSSTTPMSRPPSSPRSP